MSKVLLVNPPFYRLLGSHYNANSLGIAYIASFLNQNGHNAWLYNADYLATNKYQTLEKIFVGFESYKKYFEDINNPLWQEVVEKILEFNPEWLGFTSYTANVSSIKIISNKIKKINPNIKQVVGGVHATLSPNIFSELPDVDYCVRREGEHAMLRLVNGESPDKIKGVDFRNSNKKTREIIDTDAIDNIDDLPYPEKIKLYNVDLKTVDVSYLCTIRGCPYRCNYCASPFHWKRNATRYRSPDSVLSELKLLKEKFWNNTGFDYSASSNTKTKKDLIIPDNTVVYFVDDIFTIKKQRVKEILRGMIDSNLNMPWKCEARADHLDEEICELISLAGCVRVKIGFESGSDRILKMIQKDETKEDMMRGVNCLKKFNVPFTAYFMAGFPEETDEDLKETIKFAKKIEADYYSLSVLAPYYGTKMYFDLLAEGFELSKKPWEYFYHQTGDLMVNNLISNKVLEEYLSLNYNKNYI
jgi:anaerobic magnesium-protoporphyrin IX monomethyl ester cyclase